jgi:site-specific DNA recombinase
VTAGGHNSRSPLLLPIGTLFGGMSKGERNRVKVRVRAAMAQQATQGRFLGGRPPYGYRLADAGPHPNPSKAAVGQRQHRLEPDDSSAPIVRRIFDEYLAGRGLFAIAESLTADGVPCPSAADPARNRHRSGIAWSKGAIRAILRNPRYTGRQVWNRQRRDEELIDVDDVALGHQTRLRWNDQADRIWSAEQAHEPIIEVELFTRAQQIADAGSDRPARSVSRRRHPYLLRGLILCGSCGRRMQGSWNHDRAHYRCRLPTEYALANKVDHPPTIYLRESLIVPELDGWIASVFDPANLDEACAALAAAHGPADEDVARAEAARRKLVDCDERLGKYRAALDAGADPTVVAGWMTEVQGDKLRAEQELVRARPAEAFDLDAIRALVEELAPITAVLADADHDKKAEVYNSLGLELTFDSERRVVTVEAAPAVYSGECRRGDLNPHALAGTSPSS